jgi:hypothetical protein
MDMDSNGQESATRRPDEGIKVHGHWTIELRDPDGTIAGHHEFKNALVNQGAQALAALLQATLHGAAAERTMAEKRADYFAAGTLVVWDVDVLNEQLVRAYRASDPQSPIVYHPTTAGSRCQASLSCLAFTIIRLVKRKEEFVAIGIGDPDHVVAPPRLLGWQRALRDLSAQLIDPIPIQLHEQTASILASRILGQDDFAPPPVDLADRPLPVGCMPSFFETQLIEVEAEGGLEVRHEEHGSQVPLVSDPLADR